jgi:hypothetical protein
MTPRAKRSSAQRLCSRNWSSTGRTRGVQTEQARVYQAVVPCNACLGFRIFIVARDGLHITQGVDAEKAAPETGEIGHGEISSATQGPAESEVQPCTNSFHWSDCDCRTQLIHQLPSLGEYYIASVAKRSKPSSVSTRVL